jgi:ABC-type transporter lipoprotein component MlaA
MPRSANTSSSPPWASTSSWCRTAGAGVHSFLGDLSLPIIFVNDLLQGEFSRAGKSIWRLAINSILGLGGFFDPASKIGIGGLGWQWTR